MSKENTDSTPASTSEVQSEAPTQESPLAGLTLGEAISNDLVPEAPVEAPSTEVESEAGDSNSEVETSEAAQTTEEQSSSQSEDTVADSLKEPAAASDEDQEKAGDLEGQMTKLSDSYKRLEKEFHSRNRISKSLEEEISKKDQKIKDLERELRGDTTSTDVSPSIIDEVREQNPEAAKLLEAVVKETQAKVDAQYKDKLEALENKFAQQTKQENLNLMDSKLAEFEQKFPTLQDKLVDVINEYFPSMEDFQKAAAEDPELYNKLHKEFTVKYYREIAEAEKGSSKSETEAKRKKEIANAKGVGKPKTSSPEESNVDWSDLSDPKKYAKAPKDKQDAWKKKHHGGLTLGQL